MSNTIRVGKTELRLNKNGTVDEMILYNEKGEYILHLEQMDKGQYWLRVEEKQTDGKSAVVLWFNSKHSIRVDYELDGVEAVDDRARVVNK